MVIKYKYIGIDQYENITFLEKITAKFILRKFMYNTARPIYKDDKSGKPQIIGYYLTKRGAREIWLDVYELVNPWRTK